MDAFAYGDSMELDVHNNREVLLSDVDPFYMSDKKKGADHNASKVWLLWKRQERSTKMVLWMYIRTTG